jgi:hypothetical protein
MYEVNKPTTRAMNELLKSREEKGQMFLIKPQSTRENKIAKLMNGRRYE